MTPEVQEMGSGQEKKLGKGEASVHVHRRHSAQSQMFENITEEILVSAV